MRIAGYLLALILVCPINANADLLSDTQKVLDFFNKTLEKTLPASSAAFNRFDTLKVKYELNIVIDTLRASYATLKSKGGNCGSSARELYAEDFQKKWF